MGRRTRLLRRGPSRDPDCPLVREAKRSSPLADCGYLGAFSRHRPCHREDRMFLRGLLLWQACWGTAMGRDFHVGGYPCSERGPAPSDAALRICRGISEFPGTDTIEKASVIPGTAFLGLHTKLLGDQVSRRDVQGRLGEGISCPGFLHIAGHQRSDVRFRGSHAGDTRKEASCFRVSGTCLLASRGLPPKKARCMPSRLR